MPQFGSYPVVTTLANADQFMLAQASSGSEKLISFANFQTAIAAVATPPGFQFSQYSSVTNNNNGGGVATASVLSGSIRGGVTIAANRLVVGSVIRWRIAGYISTSGANRSFQLLPTLQGQPLLSNFATTIGASGALTNATIIQEGSAVVVTAGGAGTFIGQGKTIIDTVIYPQAVTTTKALDTTASALIAANSVWSGGVVTDTVTITDVLFEII